MANYINIEEKMIILESKTKQCKKVNHTCGHCNKDFPCTIRKGDVSYYCMCTEAILPKCEYRDNLPDELKRKYMVLERICSACVKKCKKANKNGAKFDIIVHK
jgi:hypothetical protein